MNDYKCNINIKTTDVIEGGLSLKEIPRISEAEWEVMKVFWSRSPLSSNEVVELLERTTQWKEKTIKTLISRLVQKQALGYTQDGRAYSYYPLVSREECIRAESQSFLKRIYGGALKPMLVHFMQDKQLTQEEIEELKRILDSKE